MSLIKRIISAIPHNCNTIDKMISRVDFRDKTGVSFRYHTISCNKKIDW